MDDYTLARQTRQIAQFSLQTSLAGGELALIQRGGLGGPYASITVSDLVGWALASGGGPLRLSSGTAIEWNGTLNPPVTLQAGPLGFSFSTSVAVSGNLDAIGLSVAGSPVATLDFVQAGLAATVSSFNGRTGDVDLLLEDVLRAGGAPTINPHFAGVCTAPTIWNPCDATDAIATTAFVQSALGQSFAAFTASALFTAPTAPTPPAGDYSRRVANTIFVTDALLDLQWQLENEFGLVAANLGASYAPINSPQFTGIPTAPTAAQTVSSGQLATTAFVHAAVTAATAGVASFNGRTGAVTLTAGDITGAGGAPLASPAFTGAPTAPTQAPGTSNTDLATCAFVAAAVAAAGAVASFNGRTGAVVLTTADVTAVGGAPIASPVFTGTPAGPTAAPATNTSQLATTAFVTAALTAIGAVTSFNGRSGAVTFQASDVSAVGGALLASPAFTGTPSAPTQAPGTSNTDIATCAFVAAALAAAGGVTTFNTRAGAVTLTTADVTAAGGAPLASPIFTGVPAGPTAAPATSTTQLATCAFVAAAVAAAVVSFNGRTGAVTLQASDVSAVGGALLASPAFTGTPTAPTAAPGTSTTQLATTAFIAAAIAAAGGVTTFNGRAGAVTLTAADITGATPAPLTGVTDGSNAAAGKVGEDVEANVALGTTTALTTGVNVNATSVSLSAGDWEISGMIAFYGATTTVLSFAIASLSTSSATLATSPTSQYGITTYGGNQSPFGNTHVITRVGPARLSLSAAATVYLVAQAGFTTSTCQIYGANIRARRMR